MKRYGCSISGRKVFEHLTYLIFFFTSLYCTNEMLSEFMTENTHFSNTKHPITRADMPTITICLEIGRKEYTFGYNKGGASRNIKYGQDFWIETMDSWELPWNSPSVEMKTLVEGRNDHDFIKQKRQITLEQLVVLKVGYLNRNCVRMQFMMPRIDYRHSMSSGDLFDLGMFSVTLSENVTRDIHKTVLYATSQNNSYGAILGRWYDGRATPVPLYKGGFNTIQITKMTRFEYLKKTCSQTSFYECVGHELSQLNSCQENGTPCSPVSIPHFSLCPTNHTQCKTSDLRSSLSKCMGHVPCISEEYSVQEHNVWSTPGLSNTEGLLKEFLNERVVKGLLNNQTSKYLVWLQFGMDNEGTIGVYANKSQKYIHREYLVWTGISVVGNIGGQLGLWVGFSFTGFVAGILKIWYLAGRKYYPN